MSVKVSLDKMKVLERLNSATGKCTEVLANEVLKDSNNLARVDSGEMVRSSIRSSNLKEGKLIWNTPYAKKAYYVGNPSKDKNPNAQLMWAHKAVAQNKEKYKNILNEVLKREV